MGQRTCVSAIKNVFAVENRAGVDCESVALFSGDYLRYFSFKRQKDNFQQEKRETKRRKEKEGNMRKMQTLQLW